MFDKYSMDFIRYLFNNNNEYKNNPFIIILVKQTSFKKNYHSILHRELEFFYQHLVIPKMIMKI